MSPLPFVKMHGLGNDFVIVDARAAPSGPFPLDSGLVRLMADRRRGIGCDQLIVLEPARDRRADLFMRIHNPDGGEAEACGNATRCVAALAMAASGRAEVAVETVAGVLPARRLGQAAAPLDDLIAVDMTPPGFDWQAMPLAGPADMMALPVAVGPLADPVGVAMPNPHAVFFVPDAEALPLEELGPRIEHHPLFTQRTNVELASLSGPDRLRVRVWERGAGITAACGSGACAVAVAAVRRGLAGRRVTIEMDGGVLQLEWREAGPVTMTGPVALVFEGAWPLPAAAARAAA